jgi:hypothetical protein
LNANGGVAVKDGLSPLVMPSHEAVEVLGREVAFGEADFAHEVAETGPGQAGVDLGFGVGEGEALVVAGLAEIGHG